MKNLIGSNKTTSRDAGFLSELGAATRIRRHRDLITTIVSKLKTFVEPNIQLPVTISPKLKKHQ